MLLSCPLGYIDPMSGTILLQVVIAGVIGCMTFLRTSIWGVIRRITGRKTPSESKPEETESVSDTDFPQSRAA